MKHPIRKPVITDMIDKQLCNPSNPDMLVFHNMSYAICDFPQHESRNMRFSIVFIALHSLREDCSLGHELTSKCYLKLTITRFFKVYHQTFFKPTHLSLLEYVNVGLIYSLTLMLLVANLANTK